MELAIYFEGQDVESALGALEQLPEPLRPVFFSEEESVKDKKDLVKDDRRFKRFRRDRSLGFFLFAEHCLYDISTRPNDLAVIYVDPKEDADFMDLAPAFFESMSTTQPVFGYAADTKEREHRNRLFKEIGVNNIEAWVGRDPSKYVPGLYWHTLLSDQIVSDHEVDIGALSSKAESSWR